MPFEEEKEAAAAAARVEAEAKRNSVKREIDGGKQEQFHLAKFKLSIDHTNFGSINKNLAIWLKMFSSSDKS